MTLSLKDRVCIITGAGQGIGEAVARGFAKRGATVIATSLEKPDVQGAALNLAWDVSDAKQAPAIMEKIAQQFGRIDCLVANAGIYPRQPWNEISEADWRSVLGVNLDGTWFAAQAAAKYMTQQGYGKIVTVTSVEVAMGVAVHAHYDAAKAGIIGLTRALARALGPSGVRVNAIMPGAVRTPTELLMFKPVEPEPGKPAPPKLSDRQCLPGRIESDDIEPSFAFLCAAESDPMTAQVLCVDHGLVCW